MTDAITNKLRDFFQGLQTPVLYSKVPLRLDPPSSATAVGSLSPPAKHEFPTADLLEGECTILYVGGESLGLTNILMTHASCQVNLSEFYRFLR
jgi:diphthamide biosynthesis protein 2